MTRVPVAEEEVVVGSTTSSERVRVKLSVRSRDELVRAVAHLEDVDVEHVAVNRIVVTPPEVRVEGDTTIVPVLEEVIVVEKQLVLKEEIRVRRRQRTERREFTVPLRAEQVEIERTRNEANDGPEHKRSTSP
jgi:stress response protein YsnF